MTSKLDIFDVLNEFNAHNVEFFDTLTDEQNKQVHPFVTQRWLSGTSNELQVLLINEYSNTKVFNFAHTHRKLAWYLQLASTMRGRTRYSWNKTAPKKGESSKPVSVDVIMKTYNYSSKDALEVLPIFCEADIIDMAEMLGMQPAELKQINKEFHIPKTKR